MARNWQANLQALEDVDEVGGALGTARAEQGGLREATRLLHDLQHRQLLLLLCLQQLKVQDTVSEDSSVHNSTKGTYHIPIQLSEEA